MVSQAEHWGRAINRHSNVVRFITARKASATATSVESSDWKDESTDPRRRRSRRYTVLQFADNSKLLVVELITLTYPYIGRLKTTKLHTIWARGYAIPGVSD